MKEYKNIIFDLDNVLSPTYEFVLKARSVAIEEMIKAGLNADKEQATLILNKIIKKKGSNYDKHYNELVKYFNGK